MNEFSCDVKNSKTHSVVYSIADQDHHHLDHNNHHHHLFDR